MAGKLLLQSTLLSLDSVSLGRLVADIKVPQRRFHDPFEGELLSSTVQVEQDVTEMSQRFKNKGVGVNLTEFVSLFRTTREAQGFRVQAVGATTRILNQWDDLFREACSREKTRKWLEDLIEDGKDVYFTVGYRTFLDLSAQEDVKVGHGRDNSVQLPLTTVAEANVPGLRLGTALDPAVVFSKDSEKTAERSFNMSGESVYAVQYCKVNFKWFSSEKVESSSLGKNRWKIYLGLRDLEDDEDDDVVEVELLDEWDVSGDGLDVLE